MHTERFINITYVCVIIFRAVSFMYIQDVMHSARRDVYMCIHRMMRSASIQWHVHSHACWQPTCAYSSFSLCVCPSLQSIVCLSVCLSVCLCVFVTQCQRRGVTCIRSIQSSLAYRLRVNCCVCTFDTVHVLCVKQRPV